MCHNRGARGEKTLPVRPYATGRGDLKNINGVSVDDKVYGVTGEDVVVGDVGSADFHGGQMGMSEYSIIFAK